MAKRAAKMAAAAAGGTAGAAVVELDAREESLREVYADDVQPTPEAVLESVRRDGAEQDARNEQATAAPAIPRMGIPWTVKISDIWIDEGYDRKSIDRGKVEQLAAGIRAVGLRQPIALAAQVGPGGEPWRLVFGRRRLVAYQILQLAEIPSLVGTYASETQVHAVRAIENRDREDLTPLEDVMGVCSVIDLMVPTARERTGIPAPASPDELEVRAEGEVRRVAISLTAEVMGRSIDWVRERSYVARLAVGGKARRLVESGRLSLGHARIIARLGDPRQQDLHAEWAAYSEEGTGGMSLERLENMVRGERLSLKVVPWMLGTAFGGMPACTNCPDNTANDVGLFGAEDGPDGVGGGVGTCTNRACFERKRSATERSIESRVRQVERASKKDPELKLTEKGLTAAGLVPEYVKPATFARKVQQEVAPPPPPEPPAGAKKAGTKGAAKSPADEKPDPKAVAARKLEAAERAWSGDVSDPFWKLVRASPGRMIAVWGLLQTTTANKAGAFCFGSESKAQRTARTSPKMAGLLAVLKKPTIEGLHAIEKDIDEQVQMENDVDEVTLELLEAMARAMGAELPPRPTIDAFLKGGAVTAGICRVCGCSEEDACEGGCGWADPEQQTLCTSCVGKAEGGARGATPAKKNGGARRLAASGKKKVKKKSAAAAKKKSAAKKSTAKKKAAKR